MASGALPPGFPPVEIENELYWDGGLVSNTPLQYVFREMPKVATLMLQVDLFAARGPRPRTIQDVNERAKDIRFSSRTRLNSTVFADFLKYRRMVGRLVEMLPPEMAERPEVQEIARESDVPDMNLVHLIYRRKQYDAAFKDYEFSFNTMKDHWQAGYATMRRTLRHADWFQRPDPETGFALHDVHAEADD
jgi:NTE family protein